MIVVQSCPTLYDPMDCSLPGSSVHGILQAKISGWAVIPFSKGSSQPRDRTGSPALQVDALPAEPQGSKSKLLFKPSCQFQSLQHISSHRKRILDFIAYISIYIQYVQRTVWHNEMGPSLGARRVTVFPLFILLQSRGLS